MDISVDSNFRFSESFKSTFITFKAEYHLNSMQNLNFNLSGSEPQMPVSDRVGFLMVALPTLFDVRVAVM